MLESVSHSEQRSTESLVTLNDLIPEDHIIRKIDAAIQWNKHCAPLRACYNAERGRPAFEPDVLLAIALLRHLYHMDSLRAAVSEFQTNLVYRWFIGCPLHENVPHFSTISANMLHRIPKKLFEASFAGALCDIIDAGILQPNEVVYESVYLTKDGELFPLINRYYVLNDQIALPTQIAPPSDKRNESITEQLHFSIE